MVTISIGMMDETTKIVRTNRTIFGIDSSRVVGNTLQIKILGAEVTAINGRINGEAEAVGELATSMKKDAIKTAETGSVTTEEAGKKLMGTISIGIMAEITRNAKTAVTENGTVIIMMVDGL